MNYNQFRRAIRAYYGTPVFPAFISTLWRRWKNGDRNHPALKRLTMPPSTRQTDGGGKL